MLKWHGEIWSSPLGKLRPADLTALWDSSGLRYYEGSPLVAPLGQPEVPKPIATRDLREVLTAVPEAAPEQRRLLHPKEAKEPRNSLFGFLDLLASVFDSRHNQRYLKKMMRSFEREQWSEALRYAIPINRDSSENTALQSVLAKLRPRWKLDFTPKFKQRSTLETSDSGLNLLESTYGKAFAALERAGRIEEAAFVKGELLDDPQGAVELLERHELYERAAQLATIKGLPASLQVRLWFQAGETSRALQLARIHNAHAAASYSLEMRDPESARSFRAIWARDLADSGQFAQAVLNGWSAREILPELLGWSKQALEAGGWGARHVMQRLMSDTESARELRVGQKLSSWFSDPNPLNYGHHREFLEQLSAEKHTVEDSEVKAWASTTARKLLRRANSPWPLGEQKELDSLVDIAADPWLRADLPHPLPKSDLRLDQWKQVVETRGQLPIHDAVLTGDGRILVGFGHTGSALISSRGAVSQRFSIPAHDLIAPRNGDLFLVHSLGRLARYRNGCLEPLCSVEIDGFADCHDDSGWNVWWGKNLYRVDLGALLDLNESRWTAPFHAVLPEEPVKLCVDPQSIGVLTQHHAHYFHTPDWKLIGSRKLEPAQPYLLTAHNYNYLEFFVGQYRYQKQALAIQGRLVDAEYREPYGVLTSRQDDQLTLCIFHTVFPARQLILELPGAAFARVRVCDNQAVISDSCGRLLVADLRNQTWLGKFFL